MITIRKSQDRGNVNHGWLKSKHTFSFGDYYDARHIGFGSLRVINEDRIEGGSGFDTHSHQDMEIISYVVDGVLEHKDSMGHSTLIKPGEVQRMSAGKGMSHSEYNHLKNRPTHFLQIWIIPDRLGITPSYEQKNFEDDFKSNDLTRVASKSGKHDTIKLNQDVDIYVAKAKNAGQNIHKTSHQRHLWVQVIQGDVKLDEVQLNAGDGAGLQKIETLQLKWSDGSEFILFDMA